MLDLYPQQVARGKLQDIWRTAPVSLETCGVPESWKQWGFSLKPILDQALRWHASTINIKSSKIPPEWKPAFDEFQKQVGYRFTLKKLEYPAHVSRGSMAQVNMWWFNAGVAPVYRDYLLALEIGSAVIPLEADIRQWLPGDSVPGTSNPGNIACGWLCSIPLPTTQRFSCRSRDVRVTVGTTWATLRWNRICRRATGPVTNLHANSGITTPRLRPFDFSVPDNFGVMVGLRGSGCHVGSPPV
jgi:hypothetical protein